MDAHASENDRSGEDDSNKRPSSNGLTSDVYFDPVMPELSALRDQVNSKESTIRFLEDSVTELKSQKSSMSQNLNHQAREIETLREQLQIAEDASLRALKDVCQERDRAEKLARDSQHQYQMAQLKLKRETARYLKLHKNWETGRKQWADERQAFQELRKRAATHLVALTEKLLDMSNEQLQPGRETDVMWKADASTLEPNPNSIGVSQRNVSTTSRSRERSKSRKRQSARTVGDAVPAIATSTPKMPQAPLDNVEHCSSHGSNSRGRKARITSSTRADPTKGQESKTSRKQSRSQSAGSRPSRSSGPKSRQGRQKEQQSSPRKDHKGRASVNVHMDQLSAAIPSWTDECTKREVPVSETQNRISRTELDQNLTELTAQGFPCPSRPPNPPISSLSAAKVNPVSLPQAILIPPRSSSVGFHQHQNSAHIVTYPQRFPPILKRYLDDAYDSRLGPDAQEDTAVGNSTLPKLKSRLLRRVSRMFSK